MVEDEDGVRPRVQSAAGSIDRAVGLDTLTQPVGGEPLAHNACATGGAVVGFPLVWA